MKDIFEKIEASDLTEDLELIANVVGIDVIRNFLRHFQGAYIYIPKVSRLERFVIRYTNENPDKTIKELAIEMGVSAQYLWKLRRLGKIGNSNKPKKTD